MKIATSAKLRILKRVKRLTRRRLRRYELRCVTSSTRLKMRWPKPRLNGNANARRSKMTMKRLYVPNKEIQT
jgi:hypothetical protein